MLRKFNESSSNISSLLETGRSHGNTRGLGYEGCITSSIEKEIKFVKSSCTQTEASLKVTQGDCEETKRDKPTNNNQPNQKIEEKADEIRKRSKLRKVQKGEGASKIFSHKGNNKNYHYHNIRHCYSCGSRKHLHKNARFVRCKMLFCSYQRN